MPRMLTCWLTPVGWMDIDGAAYCRSTSELTLFLSSCDWSIEVTAEAVVIALAVRRSAVTTNSRSSSESAAEPDPPSGPCSAPAADPNPVNASPRQAANADAHPRRVDNLLIEFPRTVLLVDAN